MKAILLTPGPKTSVIFKYLEFYQKQFPDYTPTQLLYRIIYESMILNCWLKPESAEIIKETLNLKG